MPGPKKGLPAPIDRPLSRAYLREFSGWSTAYPPGLSEPTSQRVMENMQCNRDGSLRIRPGLALLTWGSGLTLAPMKYNGLVGSFELFYLNNGSKAYLFAQRELDNTVTFRVARFTGDPAHPWEVGSTNHADVLLGVSPILPSATTYVKFLQIDNKIIALSNGGASAIIFYVGSVKKTVIPQSVTAPDWTNGDKPIVVMPNKNAVENPVTYPPILSANQFDEGERNSAPFPWDLLLQDADEEEGLEHKMGFWYTFENEFGESAASKVTVVRITRPWEDWKWRTSWIVYGASPPPDGNETTTDALLSRDTLFIYPSTAALTAAKAAGATKMLVYAVSWSDQDSVPVVGQCIGEKAITSGTAYNDAWVRITPERFDTDRMMPLPTLNNRFNYSRPPKAAQGVVAADRMVLVNDIAEGAVVRWTTNRAGEYTILTAARGGGYKTLTSGNLNIPVAVKLWQNPESKDTLTILCLGADGYSSSYYMAPGAVSGQSDSVQFMAFEETTATPGTVSTYGVEVLNNTLYHPLDEQLMKTTASNYNINHKSMTDLITDQWVDLINKSKIVSSQHDMRLYYLVHNPHGAALEAGCRGNEVWVCDTAAKTGTWSRWLTQGVSLRKVEYNGQICMALTRPEGIYAFDEDRSTDQWVNAADRVVSTRSIPWKMETNTQGANRAHDAWAHLQQASLTVGNFLGTMRYGVRGFNLHGKPVEVSKVMRDGGTAPADGSKWDLEDHLLIREDMKEWRFFAESVESAGVHLPSAGMLNLVQYRYTPVSVNVGYEYGSVETFEYTRDVALLGTNTVNGVPVPAVDMRRP